MTNESGLFILDYMQEISSNIVVNLHYVYLRCECIGEYDLKNELIGIIYQIMTGLYETAYIVLASIKDDIMKADIKEGRMSFQNAFNAIEAIIYDQ